MNFTKASADHRRMGDYYRRIGQWRKANREYDKADALDTAKTIKNEMRARHDLTMKVLDEWVQS